DPEFIGPESLEDIGVDRMPRTGGEAPDMAGGVIACECGEIDAGDRMEEPGVLQLAPEASSGGACCRPPLYCAGVDLDPCYAVEVQCGPRISGEGSLGVIRRSAGCPRRVSPGPGHQLFHGDRIPVQGAKI